ncbi:protein kinase [Actinomadura graeca]|uniref:Serine/threonine-protein kinase PknG n=1 Tax=Actinomadura graeca TaxID=2750812 RepID=A0ABX8R3R1_9ACTN|nr:serine/threonine-protein kinase [Actinomadura graeca]QXJ25720.1 protein kinase [Actinomadura graeca]
MTHCDRPACAGAIDETGFCDTCGRRPLYPGAFRGRRPEPRAEGSAPSAARAADSAGGSAELRVAAGLVVLPVLSSDDPDERVITDPGSLSITRKHTCGERVSVAYAGQPALLMGFCPNCGVSYDFRPRLTRGDVLGDQYTIVGPIAHGGQGWIYVARDRHLDGNLVAVKALIEPNDPIAIALGINERRYLTTLDHPNIVRIFNFVTHDSEEAGDRRGYLIMEYLNGRSLREVINAARGSDGEPLAVEHVIGYGYEILLALEYLHGRGLLYCDMKPDNVVLTQNGVKLVDMGAVCRIGDPDGGLVGTAGYMVGKREQAEGLSVQSDLYAVGKTLRDLLAASRPGARTGASSLDRLIGRATNPNRTRRFASAAEMAGQLLGVLEEELALKTGRQHATPSALFEPSAVLLDGGLGAVPPTEPPVRPRPTAPERPAVPAVPAVLAPSPADRAASLPVPRVPPDDPLHDLLSTAIAEDPHGVLGQLADVGNGSAAAEFHRCRAHLLRADLDAAAASLRGAERITGGRDWRTVWHHGLLALARAGRDGGDGRPVLARVTEAGGRFDAVHGDLPGESAPKLALGHCAELLGEPDEAERLYEAVWRRDRSQVNAAFGLARLRMLRRDRAGAAAVLDQVPKVSRHYDAARIAALRVHLEPLPSAPPGVADLDEAERRLPGLVLDGGEPEGRARERLRAAIFSLRLDRLGPADDTSTEKEVRGRLETSLKNLAGQAGDHRARSALLDAANAVRPWSWL